MASKNDKLNYECVLLGSKEEAFDFHGDNLALAEDHVIHVLLCSTHARAKWRKKGAVRWKEIELPH